MAFCKFSSECVLSNSTQVDNIFLNQFLPTAPNICVKVYIYGLYKCTNPNAYNNTVENFASELGVSVQDIEDAFLYWQDLGLVDILMGTSFQVRYVPLKNAINSTKKFSKTKYSDFNKKAQEIIEGRMITSTEYTEYYTVMEVFQIDPKAFILVMDYCTQIKGKNVGYAYIITVARNWASEGITTYDAVLEKIKSYNCATTEINKILKICGFKRSATVEEQDKFLKWTKDYDFSIDTIKFVADMILQKQNKVNFAKIDAKLTIYYEAKRVSIDEITDFENRKTEMFEIAKNVCKNIGVYYENLENIVDKYITKWLDLGHSSQSILTLANYCFKNSIRSLDGLDTTILKLYKLGLVSEKSIEEHLISLVKQDEEIRQLLEKLGLSRKVNSQDRDFWKTWKFSWDMPMELIDFAVEKGISKTMPMQYINKILSTWHTDGIKTKAQAEKTKFESAQTIKQAIKSTKNYEKEDLSALFDSLEEVDV